MAEDFARTKSDEFYAATPSPLSKFLIELYAVKRGYKTMTADVSVAFLHALQMGHVYIVPPNEFWSERYPRRSAMWKLKKQLYGQRGAPKAWQSHLRKVLEDLGFVMNPANPTMFFHEEKKALIDVHVDDFHAAGPDEALLEVFAELSKVLMIKTSPLKMWETRTSF